MPKIFVCYRRADSDYPAQQIYRELSDYFGSKSVVFDVDTIPLGIDFREYLNKEVSKCDILLAVIGDQWIEILKQRLNEPNDFIRVEIQAALERQIPVVPVLVGKASVPGEKDLPPELVGLAYRNAAEVRAGPDLQTHLKRLIDGLDYLLPGCTSGKEPKQKEEQKHKEVLKRYTNSIGMAFVAIPTGSFTMGSSTDYREMIFFKNTEEKPPHKVKISQSYYLQTTQVTQGQWQAIMGNNPSKFKDFGADCPVEIISWQDAQNFIKKLNKIDSTNKYRLPTEAEWEYACRAGATTSYSFGDDAGQLGKYAWYSKNSKGRTHPVGTKESNAWGLYDMHGNVSEWVEDDWHKNYDNAPIDGKAWIDEPRGELRVFRVGSWSNGARDCRAAYRISASPDGRGSFLGFRLARSVALGS